MIRSLLLLAVLSLTKTTSAFQQVSRVTNRRDAFSPIASIFVAGQQLKALPTNAIDLGDYVDGPRGILYQVTKASPDGIKPERSQKVKTLYTLYLGGFAEDGGKQIDSSKKWFGLEKPFEFVAGVSQVIKAWDLSILDMRVGEARRLIVPPDLGYGEKGAGGSIPGGSTLYFEMELVEVGAKPKLRPEQEKWLEEHPL
jgi:FKBP-type peptidyl-prolyl cis-trans isomerase